MIEIALEAKAERACYEEPSPEIPDTPSPLPDYLKLNRS